MSISHLFFDIGGVLGTNGWSSPQRRRAVERFGLDPAEFEQQHRDAVGTFEQGRMTLDEYLDSTVFYRERDFSREAFVEFMLAESRPDEAAIALARRLADTGKYRMMTLNNESLELNRYRIERFGLQEIFEAFFSSCWLGFTKPSRRIYELALGISQARPECAVLIDDRSPNLVPARALGMRTIHFTDCERLAGELAALGVAHSTAAK
ncbi:MAG: HAD-IA family hydrolase [Gemmatimonadales bacterium]|nr:HAD-IA family hydrolase [Gemmatimonadales bacterium]MDQ3427253.1 HAD-IA family hydrolase [Gemmatimonadota bacterium]